MVQVPRLTAVLRALAPNSAAAPFDADAAFIPRQQLLQKRMQQQNGSQQQQQQLGSRSLVPPGFSKADNLGKSALAQMLLGNWATGRCSAAGYDVEICRGHPTAVEAPADPSAVAYCA